MLIILGVVRKHNSIDLISLDRTEDAPILSFVSGTVHRSPDKGNPKSLRGLSRCATPRTIPTFLRRNKENLAQFRYSLGEQLKALAPAFNTGIKADPGDVAARMCKAR